MPCWICSHTIVALTHVVCLAAISAETHAHTLPLHCRRERPIPRQQVGRQGVTLCDMFHRWKCGGSVRLSCVSMRRAWTDIMLKSRIVGFEDLGNNDNFSTAMLEFRLKKSGECTSLQQKLKASHSHLEHDL